MARLPRYVIPGQPQHIIQRGNNQQAIFAAEADYQFFRDALVEAAQGGLSQSRQRDIHFFRILNSGLGSIIQ